MSSSPYAERPRGHELRIGPVAIGLAVLGIAVLGGAAALAIALSTGALHTTTRATTVVESAPGAVTSGRSGADWSSVYTRAAPGTVDVTIRSTTRVNTPLGPTDQQATSTGSGFVIDGAGHILTAAHLTAGATRATVLFQSGVSRTAALLGSDNSSDVSLLRVDPAGLDLHPETLGSSRALTIGSLVGVVGDPLGFDRSLSTGVVSGLDRTIEAPNGFMIAHSVQTDAALNPGNSGGPVLDSRGRVIGIADQIATGPGEFGSSTSQTNTGVGFAVPIDLVKAELGQLEHGQSVDHAYLGVSTAAAGGSEAGALVATVEANSPASRAGLRSGDVIVALGGKAVRGPSDLIDALAGSRPGTGTKITVLRDSQRVTIAVTLVPQPAQAPTA